MVINHWLVVWIFMTFHILGIILPTDELKFCRGVETTNHKNINNEGC